MKEKVSRVHSLPLAGVRIVDFSTHVAGPFCTLLLAFLGAEVIRVESKVHPDAVRVRRPGDAAEYNHNKLAVCLNLTRPEAIAIAKRLVNISDAVVESFRPGVFDKLGLGYEILKEVKSDIIMLSLSGFGATGPERRFTAFAPIFAAMGGLAYATGYPDGIPTELRGTADIRVGQMAAFALLSALLYHKRTYKGQYIDISARETLSCLIGDVIMDYTMNRRNQGRKGNRDDMMAPHGCYRCKGEDKWVTIATSTNEEWEALCKAMGKSELAQEMRFADSVTRWQNQDELDKLISAWSISLTPYEAMDRLQGAQVAAVVSFNCEDLFLDPHLKERDFTHEVEFEQGKKRSILSSPWIISGTRPAVYRRGPEMGQDNLFVFGQLLGMSSSEIVRLEREKVIY